jgi:metallophosphoesterase superfamily enzyme
MRRLIHRGATSTRQEIRPGVYLDSRLALWVESARLLVVADLHWGYADSHRAQGNLLPLWGDDQIAQRLDSLSADYVPAEIIWLGDSLHTLAGARAAENYLARSNIPITVVSGNHDRAWKRADQERFVERGRFLFHHGDAAREVPPGVTEVIGHLHPAVTWSDGAGTCIKMPALVASERRLVLPAFSPWAGGALWKSAASGETLYAITAKRIFTVPVASAHKDPATK